LGLAACNGTSGKSESDGSAQTPSTSNKTPISPPTSTPTLDQVYTGPAEVQKYVIQFIDDAKTLGIDVLPDMQNPKLEIRISSLDSYGASVIGLCETGGNKRRVTFDPEFWNLVSETQKEILAYHEFGHCVLNRPHRPDLLDAGAYASVMYPVIMSSSTYTNNYSYYQEELFTWNSLALSNTETIQETTHICNY
jgi:hypothetical protein